MGQYWTIFNIDKDKAISPGKVQEDFFTRLPTEIMHSLFLINDKNAWTGDRIVYLGDNSDAEFFPKNVFSKEEWEEFNFEENETDSLFEQLSDYSRFIKVRSHFYGEDYSKYVLRNLNKKEYIRGDNPPKPYKRMPVTMGHAFLSMIGCSYPDSAPDYMNLKAKGFHDFDQGKWAGDRFDVVPYDDVKDLLESDGWKDVSEYVNEYLKIVFKAS